MKPIPTSLSLLAFGALFAGCSSNDPKFQPNQLPIIGEDRGSFLDETGKHDWYNDDERRFLALNKQASDLKATSADQLAFVKAGLNLSDQIANRWFREQFAQDTQSRYANNTFNMLAGAGTALMGITDASGKAVAILGATTSATNAQLKNYEASYLLSSALPLVLKKLREFRKTRRDEIIEYFASANVDYFQAVSELRRYHQTAAREVIKRFIEESAELAAFTTKPDEDGGASGIRAAPLNAALFEVLNDGATGTFSKTDLITIYALVTESRTSNLVTEIEASAAGKYLSELISHAQSDDKKKGPLMKLAISLNSLLSLDKDVAKKMRAVERDTSSISPAGSGDTGDRLTKKLEELQTASTEAAKLSKLATDGAEKAKTAVESATQNLGKKNTAEMRGVLETAKKDLAMAEEAEKTAQKKLSDLKTEVGSVTSNIKDQVAEKEIIAEHKEREEAKKAAQDAVDAAKNEKDRLSILQRIADEKKASMQSKKEDAAKAIAAAKLAEEVKAEAITKADQAAKDAQLAKQVELTRSLLLEAAKKEAETASAIAGDAVKATTGIWSWKNSSAKKASAEETTARAKRAEDTKLSAVIDSSKASEMTKTLEQIKNQGAALVQRTQSAAEDARRAAAEKAAAAQLAEDDAKAAELGVATASNEAAKKEEAALKATALLRSKEDKLALRATEFRKDLLKMENLRAGDFAEPQVRSSK